MAVIPQARGGELSSLVGTQVVSEISVGAEYRIGHRLATGATSAAFFAMRYAPEGQCPVVLKVLRPDFIRSYGPTAKLTVQKEAVALGRLNERVPSTPFVVRLIDTGVIRHTDALGDVELPWVAVEYMHGGAEGTTLTQRVARCIEETAAAFEPHRALRAVACLANGLSAVHEVGVIHRDLKPGNVLCCGLGDDEIFKVADFGVARPLGLTGTFCCEVVGTPGYVAPEAFAGRGVDIGPWTDIFGLSCVVFFLLTGQKYLPVKDTSEMVQVMSDPHRRSILESPFLSPEMRRRATACRAIDRALAQATALDPHDRPQTAEAFGASIIPWLQTESKVKGPNSRADSRTSPLISGGSGPWTWILRHRPSDDFVVRKVAWDVDGRCLSTTNDGLLFWNGTSWQTVPMQGGASVDDLRFVQRIGPGRWTLGYGRASLATFAVDGMLDSVDLSDQIHWLDSLSGDLGDLAVMVEKEESGRLALRAMSNWRWVRACGLDGVSALNSVARIGDARWLLAGRTHEGRGFVASYSPLDFDLRLLPSPPVRAFVACAGRDTIDSGVAAGADGTILWCEGLKTTSEFVDGGHDVSAVAVDPSGGGWAAGAGRIWRREVGEPSSKWPCVWENKAWDVPFVSIFADIGVVTAVTADGAIIEGRAPEVERDTEMSRGR